MSYPNNSGFVAHSDTSKASALALDESGNAATYERIITDYLLKAAIDGATADELRLEMQSQFPKLHNGTINGRLSTLWRNKVIGKCIKTRLTSSGRQAHVYVHGNYISQVPQAPTYEEAVGPDPIAALNALKYLISLFQMPNEYGVYHGSFTETDAVHIKELCQRAGVPAMCFGPTAKA